MNSLVAGMFLSRDDLVRLTGKKYASAQKKILRERRIRFLEDAAGRPIVARASIEAKLIGNIKDDQPAPGPDFTAFPKVA